MSRPILTVEIDAPVPHHATVLINGKLYQLGEMPAWTQRPAYQPPLWVSEDAARVIEWALSIAGDPDPEATRKRGMRPRLAGEFSPAEAMEHFYGPRNDADEAYHKDRRAWWDAVKTELRQGNLLAEVGYVGYRPTAVARDRFTPPPSRPVRSLT